MQAKCFILKRSESDGNGLEMSSIHFIVSSSSAEHHTKTANEVRKAPCSVVIWGRKPEGEAMCRPPYKLTLKLGGKLPLLADKFFMAC
jgi:hypothetical protein